MTGTPSVHRSMISARSRRLRTIGLLLLIAALGMAIYGMFVLMPKVKRSLGSQMHLLTAARRQPATANAQIPSPQVKRARRIALVQVTFIYTYWTVCALLVLAVFVIAWLDLREVQRNYLKDRRSLWMEAARSLQRDDTQTKQD